MVYKIDILSALKSAGWNTADLRKENDEARERGEKSPGLSENTIQRLRHNQPISMGALDVICEKLNCQPGDLIEHV